MTANAPNYIAPEPTSEQIALDEDVGALHQMFERLKTTITLANACKALCSSKEAEAAFETIATYTASMIHDSSIEAVLRDAKEAGHLIQAYRENP